jgi:hypothetical protein
MIRRTMRDRSERERRPVNGGLCGIDSPPCCVA